jgi:hypothetical protein
LLASFAGPPPGPRPLAEIISDLKSALGMTTTQGLYGMQVRRGDRTWGFWPRTSVGATVYKTGRKAGQPLDNVRTRQAILRGQYDPVAGVARIHVSTDIDAIAHEGGHHLERVFGAPLETFKTQHSEELAVPPAPDAPLPAINPAGFSGIELDADTQHILIEAANRMREWRQLAATARQNRTLAHQIASDAATARNTLQRRLGRTIAEALIADLVGDAGRPNNGALGQTPYRLNVPSMPTTIDPARLADYVRERYSQTGTPVARVAPTPSPFQVSEGFAEFFESPTLRPVE